MQKKRVLIMRVLAVYKKSTFQDYSQLATQRRLSKLLAENSPAVGRVLESHRDHLATMDDAKRVFSRLGVDVTFRSRGRVGKISGFDLVVTLGGDGTLLWASHAVGVDVPVLGINTAPKDSVGFFCGATKHNLETSLSAALQDGMPRTVLQRMTIRLDGEVISSRVLNDVLFTHTCPASTSRYILQIDGYSEEQRSSGIWVGPAAGSTAGQHSAGGDILPISSRMLQYVVREPYDAFREPYRLRVGTLSEGISFELVTKMKRAMVYLDGPHLHRSVPLGSTISVQLSPEPLTLLGNLSQRWTEKGATDEA